MRVDNGWQKALVTGAASTTLNHGEPVELALVRVVTSSLAGKVGIVEAAVEVDNIPATAAQGTELAFGGAAFKDCAITLANTGDKVIVFWRPQR